jgi:quaternary ammonium compound-resistance protein SugE
MAWFYLLLAGALEVAATTVFRYTEGLSRIGPTLAFFALGIVSFYFLYRSLDAVPLGTAYAVWTGIGAAGTVAIGIYGFGEPATVARVALLAGLIGCIVGLKFVSTH